MHIELKFELDFDHSQFVKKGKSFFNMFNSGLRPHQFD